MHFPLHPETPLQGRSLVDLFGGPEAQPRLEASFRRLKAVADEEGLPLSERTMTYNSRFAQELGVWAAQQGKGEAYHDAVFRAYFVDRANIASRQVLLDVVAKVGLDVDEAATVLDERRQQNAVNDDWERSMRAGVTGIPTFEAGGRRVEGAEPYEVLEGLVVAAGARKRPPGGER